MNRFSIIVPALAFMLAACSSQIVKKDELAQIHRAAIIGLDLQQQKSVSGEDLLSIALKTNKNEATMRGRTESEHVNSVYLDLAQKMAKDTGWKLLSENQVRESAAYKEFFKSKTDGLQARPAINNRYNYYQAPGILDTFAILTAEKEKLTALAKAMNVDALIFASSTVNLNNDSFLASMVGKGEFHPSSSSTVFIIDGRTGEKIFMSSAEGPKLEQGEKNALGMASEDNLNNLAQLATGKALAMVLKELPVTR